MTDAPDAQDAFPASGFAAPEADTSGADALSGFLDDAFEGEVDPFRDHADLRVAAVVVGHDGEPWLPVTLAALRAQDRPVDAVVAVDTGSRDATGALLREALGTDRVLALPREASFGAAVAAGAEAAGPVDWIWVLHDDCAPRSDALRRLLDAAQDRVGAAIVGPKVLGWADRTHLLEVGLTMARGGRRVTGLERNERDQGQHDQERDVLAVGSAGMLIRADVWEQLGGFDPELRLFRDDVDLGWRAQRAGHRVVVAPRAVVHHAEAGARRRRSLDAITSSAHRADRGNAMLVVLANSSPWMVPLIVLRLLFGSIGRVVLALIGKDVGEARAEAGAAWDVFGHPGRLRAARRRRAGARVVPDREVSRLLAPPGAQVRQLLENIAGLLTTSSAPEPGPRAAETGPGDDDFDDLGAQGPGVVGRALRRPGVLATLVVALVALLALRALLGPGRLLGGALLPAPDGIGTWWSDFLAPWHPVSIGSPESAPPTTALLAAVGVPFLGQAPLVIDVLVLLAVPLAFASAYASLAGVTRSLPLRLWASVSYALLPAVTGAIAAGRIGTLLVAVLLPALARAFAHLVGLGADPPGPRAAWGTALLVGVMGAFVPMIWVLVVILALVAGVTVSRGSAAWRRLAVVCIVPPLLWLPWSLRLLTDPQLLLLEAGATPPGLADPALPPWSLLGLDPGGPGTPTWWVGIGVVAAALVALLRPARRDPVRLAWGVALLALLVAAFMAVVTVTPPGSVPAAAWPGPVLLVAGAALLVAGVVGNEASGRRLAATGFSWRQIVAAAVTALAVLAPAVWALTWVDRGAAGPIARTDPQLLPAFVAAQSLSPDRPRTLVLRQDTNRVAYAVLRSTGPIVGDAEVVPSTDVMAGLDEVVADLASGRGGVQAERLASYAVAFVQIDAPVPTALADRLDAVPGLNRIGAPDGGALWRVAPLAARARIEPERPGGRPVALKAGEIGASGRVPDGWRGGRVVLADPADSGWRATLDGRPLTPVVQDGWAQAWELPAGSTGRISIAYTGSGRTAWLFVSGIVLILTIVLALPARRYDEDEGEDA
jgi:GT2 family glycosyltransferase